MIDFIKTTQEYKNFQILVKNNKLSHAYLIYSNNENVNISFCKALALLLIDKEEYPDFHPDILLYPKEKSLVVEDSTEIIENANIKPMIARCKIFIISNIDKATVQAQNKLLKTIEEAGNDNIFLFNATNKNLVLQTIQSRTQLVNIDSIIKEDVKTAENYTFIVDLLKNMKSSQDVLSYVNRFADKKAFIQNLKTLENILERILFCNYGMIDDNEILEFSNEFPQEAIGEMFKLIINAKRQFEANVNVNIISDMLLLKILEVKHYAKN